MPTTITLPRMSVKYLTEFLAAPGWTKTVADIYIAGQVLSEKLPTFGEGSEHQMPKGPVPKALTTAGAPDWSRMSQIEATEFRQKLADHNAAMAIWGKVPLEIELTDKQFNTCQACVKEFATPISEEQRIKNREKQLPERAELPINEHSFALLSAFKLGD